MEPVTRTPQANRYSYTRAKWLRRAPNVLTCLRALLVVPLLLVFQAQSLPALIWTCVIVAFMGLTDLLDGLIARRYRATRTGELLDSTADGMARFTIWTLLAGAPAIVGLGTLVPAWMVVVMMWRDLLSWSLRFLGLLRGDTSAQKRFSGKLNGFVQSLAIAIVLLVLLVAQLSPAKPAPMLVHVTVLLAVLVAAASAIDLLLANRRLLRAFWRAHQSLP
jgi:phosphatidylglycerophosphate synthase